MNIGMPEALVITAIASTIVIVVFPAGRICRRLGFPTWLGILAVLPIVNVLLLWYVAMAPWPSLTQAKP